MGLLNQTQQGLEQTEPASPEEQREYEDVVNTATAFIFDKKSNDKIVKMMQESEDPATVVANLTVSVGEAYETRKGKISDEVIQDAAVEVIEILFDLGEKAGAWETTEELMETALFKVYEMWGESHEEDVKASANEMAQQFQSIPPEVVSQAMNQITRKNPVAEGVQNATGAY